MASWFFSSPSETKALPASVTSPDDVEIAIDIAKTRAPSIDDELHSIARRRYAFEAAIQRALDECTVGVHRFKAHDSDLAGKITVSLATKRTKNGDDESDIDGVALYNDWTGKVGYCSNPAAFKSPSNACLADAYDRTSMTVYHVFDGATFRVSEHATGYYASRSKPLVFTLTTQSSYAELVFSVTDGEYTPTFATCKAVLNAGGVE